MRGYVQGLVEILEGGREGPRRTVKKYKSVTKILPNWHKVRTKWVLLCEHCSDLSGRIKCWKFLEWLMNCHLFKDILSPLTCLLPPPPWVEWNPVHYYWRHYWPIVAALDDDDDDDDEWQGKPEHSEKTCHSVALSITNTVWPVPGLNSDGRGGKLGSLSYGTACLPTYLLTYLLTYLVKM
jgi:hypothetical protein